MPWVCHRLKAMPGGARTAQWELSLAVLLALEDGPQTKTRLHEVLSKQVWFEFAAKFARIRGGRLQVAFWHAKGNRVEWREWWRLDCRNRVNAHDVGDAHRQLLKLQQLVTQRSEVSRRSWLPEIKQRPDLVVTFDNVKIAVEFQCAPITAQRVSERTRGFESLGMDVVWVLGPTYQQKKLQQAT
ncbi:hypothetical protein H7R52_12220 [Weissella confusa]|uniref:Competence protein CoiA nuclease-like domain-containing protein n=1 Tax=Weissella confusa TaxID=1583 RepID=A0A923SNQ5_WEICO|nr:hypothetical protein [Weissella confusa]